MSLKLPILLILTFLTSYKKKFNLQLNEGIKYKVLKDNNGRKYRDFRHKSYQKKIERECIHRSLL
jgi:hypothetical protein